jgi:hypothetical protein
VEEFEDQIRAMMDYRAGGTAPFTAAEVTAGVRRRGRQRMATVTASALAVAAVGIGAVALAGQPSAGGQSGATPAAGGAPQPQPLPVPATTTGAPSSEPVAGEPSVTSSRASKRPQPASPVRMLAAGEKIDVAPGFQTYVTSHGKCDVTSSPWGGEPAGTDPLTQCKDVDDGNFGPRDPANIALQGYGDQQTYIVSGEYLGSAVPLSIGVDYGGKHYTATILRTAGQEKWVAFSVRMTAAGHFEQPKVTAYDASGNVIAATPDVQLAVPNGPATTK